MISSTLAPLNYRRPSAFSAACPGCGRTLLGLLAALSASLPAVFAAVTVVVLVSLFPAPVEAQGDPEEPCPGGGYNPTPVAVAVTAVPIVVASTTADYFVLYVRHTVDGSEVEFPVLVKRGEVDTTTLAENVAALPKERYRVEKYLIADPADVDGDCIDDLTELTNLGSQNPVNPAAGIALTDGAVAIPDEETFTALSEVFASRSGGSTHVVKFFLGDTDTDRPLVYFMNTSKHLIHQSFIDAVGPELGRHTSGKLTYHPELVAPDGSQGLYYFSLTNLILPAFSHAERSYTQLAASMRLLDDNLAVYIPNRWLSRVQSDLQFFRASRMHLVFDEDLFSETDFQALNPGEGYGRLRALEPDERPHPRDIVLYEALPNELPRVAGIISTVPQTPLSHINLRAVQDRIPNAFIRNALDKTNITSLLDNFVRYEVTETGWELRAATKAEVDAHYESSRPAQSQTPQRDLKVTTIKPLSEVGFADWKAFGVKAANVAVLGMLGFPTGTVPTGFAIPFYFYDEFMKHNDFYTRIDTMLADPDFQSKFDTQEKELRKLRKVIKDADTPAWITTALTTMHATFPEGTSLRYRSSTNNEDLPNFNGAGLYDSKTQHPEETEEDGIDKSLKQVFASLWNFRAFIERDFHRIDHLQAAMGVLVHPSYQDERVNGVAVSFDPIYDRGDLYYVNNQVGEDLVTNPEPHSVPEELLLSRDTGRYIILSFSNLVEPGELLLSDAQVRQLRQHLTVIHDHFKGLYKPALGEPFAMEIEFKITSEKILAIKQARPWVFDGNAADEPAVLPPMVTIAAKEGASSVTEGTAAEFTLTRGPPTAAEMTVNVTVTQRGAVIQTANSYQPPEEVTFTAGDARATLTVLTDDDEQQEEDGAVIATLQPGEEYRLGESSTQSARVTVRDNEVAPPPPPPPPVLTGATVNGSTLVLTYDEALDGTSVPAAGAFVVTAAGSPITVNQVGVAGSTVTLTLASAVAHGEAVRVSYSPGTNPIQDAVGNDARGLSNQAVTNTTGAPNTAPEITTVGPFTVRENQALVGRLAARDDDSGDEVTGWSIMGGADQSQFSITSDTGDLSFQEAPDYESPTDVVSGDPPSGAGDNEYVVTVEVRSGAGARELEAEQTFTVRVTDEREPPGIPEAPAFSGETAGNLTVHWSEPDNSGPPITDYDVRYREGSRGGFTDAQHMGPGLSLTLADLEPGTAYEVQVRATNDEGTSDWSDPGEGMTVTPLTVEMMGGTEPPVEGPFTVRFSFSEPVRGFTQAAIETAQDPACTDEQNNPVFCEPDIGRLETVDDRVFSTTVTPQTDRVAHNYTLTLTVSGGAVRSSVGNKLNEEAMLGGRVAPPGVTLPISEIGLRASGLDRAGRLNWNRPTNDGGSPIIRYEHRHAPVGEVWNDWENAAAGARGVTVGNLVNGQEYVFEARAVNALGKGATETATAEPVRSTRSTGGGGGGGGGGGTPPRPTVNTDPVITTPGPFEVTENQTRVVRIEALDADPGDAIRSYAIAGGADGDRFSIVTHTGVLSFREPPNFEAPADVGSTDPPSEAGDNEYIVVVRVASGPLARDRTVEQAVAVRVTDADRESPGAPEAPRVTRALEASLTVAWAEPENPGPPITGYDVQYREGPSGFFINAPHEGTGQTATLTGLEAATLYQVQVRARNEEGTGRWSQPGEGLTLAGPTALLPFSVPDRGGFSVTSQDAEPMLRVGYGQVETDAGMTPPAGLAIFGSRVNGILVSEAGVPASAAVLEGRIFAETDGPVRTGLAMANPNDAPATIAFFFTDSNGIDSGHGTFTLGPRKQMARFLDEAPFNGGSAMRGTFTFTADLPVAVIALRGFVNERSEFLMTTLPVAPLAVPTTGTVYFPHFADGGGWTTQVILVNPTHAPISGSVQFFGPGSETEAAAPRTLTLADGRNGSTFSYAIPPRSATRLRTANPAGPLRVGSVRAVPDPGHPAPSGVSIFTFQKDGMTVSEAGVPASTSGAAFRVYVEASGTPGQPHSVRSGIALTNTSDAPTTVSLELTGLDGTATGLPESLTIPASGHIARFIDEFFPALTTPFSGILRIASTAPDIAAVGLRLAINQRHDILVTTTPPVDENAAAAASGLFFPHFVDSDGWTTQFILFSGSTGQTAAGMIRFTGQDGQPMELSVAPTTAPMIP